MIARRGFLSGIIALCAAPAIVRVGSIMPVKAMPEDLLADFTTDNLIFKATERFEIGYVDKRIFADIYERYALQWATIFGTPGQ